MSEKAEGRPVLQASLPHQLLVLGPQQRPEAQTGIPMPVQEHLSSLLTW